MSTNVNMIRVEYVASNLLKLISLELRRNRGGKVTILYEIFSADE